jgi:hypothetical protein
MGLVMAPRGGRLMVNAYRELARWNETRHYRHICGAPTTGHFDDAISERARRLEDIFDTHADALFYRHLEP